ncbi:acyltransferase domain-containing protein [Anaerocolumna aminovalerica]|uniref:acyltransferase domain-containing protein n=1 Tax=Anaerocolumna aminovalerica TaxID=1527 RepID=UPI00248C9AB8|nr:acyltransferase domain-containing protein [Anaerocolumna aminovalerica]
MNEQEFLIYFLEKDNFPKEAQEVIQELYGKILMDSDYKNRMDSLINMFMNNFTIQAFEQIDILAKDMNVHSYIMSMLLLVLSCKPLLKLYHERNISEDIYWNTVEDLTCKLNECYQLYGIWGTFVREWFPRFYQMSRFALGRMQYEYSIFQLEEYSIGGFTVKKDDKVINMHIPASGSFAEDKRMESYHKAYEFYKKDFAGRPIPVVCSSWLLYPELKDILPAHSNIRGFMNDFSYIHAYTDEFHDAWRIFGKDANKLPKDLPRDTSLQKIFAEYLEKGRKPGKGYGILLLDENGIIS